MRKGFISTFMVSDLFAFWIISKVCQFPEFQRLSDHAWVTRHWDHVWWFHTILSHILSPNKKPLSAKISPDMHSYIRAYIHHGIRLWWELTSESRPGVYRDRDRDRGGRRTWKYYTTFCRVTDIQNDHEMSGFSSMQHMGRQSPMCMYTWLPHGPYLKSRAKQNFERLDQTQSWKRRRS